MKKILSALLLLTIVISSQAQISGYMGKRFNVGFSLGVNMPSITALFDSKTDYGLNPKFILHGEYQVGRFYSLKAEVNYSNTFVPITVFGNTVEESRPTTLIIFGARKGKGMPMPVSSSYFGYGIGMAFSSTPEIQGIGETPGIGQLNASETVSMFVLNLEWGRRFVFENGLYIDGSAIFNLNTAMFKSVSSTYDPFNTWSDSQIKDLVLRQMGNSAFFNLKIGVGFIL